MYSDFHYTSRYTACAYFAGLRSYVPFRYTACAYFPETGSSEPFRYTACAYFTQTTLPTPPLHSRVDAVPTKKRPRAIRGSPTGVFDHYRLNHFLNKCFVVSLFIAAIEVVSGMPFGQERTQFCELPQPSMPPSSISASRRS